MITVFGAGIEGIGELVRLVAGGRLAAEIGEDRGERRPPSPVLPGKAVVPDAVGPTQVIACQKP